MSLPCTHVWAVPTGYSRLIVCTVCGEAMPPLTLLPPLLYECEEDEHIWEPQPIDQGTDMECRKCGAIRRA